jgi:hypothetical protein
VNRSEAIDGSYPGRGLNVAKVNVRGVNARALADQGAVVRLTRFSG